jgi:hypothetical protein
MPRYSTRPRPDQGRKEPELEDAHRPFVHPRKRIKVKDYSQMRITETIEELMNVYADSLDEFQKDPGMDQQQARANAAKVWKAELPELTDLESCLTYIALIAWGQRLNTITAQETKVMMFTAQTQLTALSRLPYERKVEAAAEVVVKVEGAVDRELARRKQLTTPPPPRRAQKIIGGAGKAKRHA